jgi:hypothetical protein
MHNSFGMECRPRSMKWDDLMRGPSRAEVRRHVRKLANYPTSTTLKRGR